MRQDRSIRLFKIPWIYESKTITDVNVGPIIIIAIIIIIIIIKRILRWQQYW